MFKHLILFSILGFTISCNSLQPQKFEAQLPQEPVADNTGENTLIKDAPIISVKKDGALFFKGENIGTVDETGNLEKEIKKIFEAKKKSNDKNATAVFVKAGRSVKYSHIAKLTDKLKALGSAPIGLQIDDLEN